MEEEPMLDWYIRPNCVKHIKETWIPVYWDENAKTPMAYKLPLAIGKKWFDKLKMFFLVRHNLKVELRYEGNKHPSEKAIRLCNEIMDYIDVGEQRYEHPFSELEVTLDD